ncbi:serum paraoxonase/arylesterase 2-like isoform X1 [Pseudophryne corroboree]|uniref:serum paraoxonase/arylesterase 2-like isoform X1 n=1 Tax=Pseudophryne corroboree TaxID=495146 RepID=UPI0030813880
MANLILFGAALSFLGQNVIHLIHRTKPFSVAEPIELIKCQLLKGIEFGSEDIEISPNGLAFISSGMKHPSVKSFAPDRPAEILLVDLNDEELHPTPLSISKGFDISTFNPHGLSIYIDEKDNAVYLFVVNHPHHKTTIEIFKFVAEENGLVHQKTIKHRLLYSVNDIVAVGPESFYATNDYYFTDGNLKEMETLIGLTWTNVVYYSPGDVREVASGLYSGNGIAMSTNKKYIYAADLTGHTINVFEKHSNWSLSSVKVVDVDIIVDNLSVDPVTGDIWTAGHPNMYSVFLYDEDNLPGSEVIRVQNIHSDNPIVTMVYANNGSVLQASSCAARYKKKLLVGSVFHKALFCELD